MPSSRLLTLQHVVLSLLTASSLFHHTSATLSLPLRYREGSLAGNRVSDRDRSLLASASLPLQGSVRENGYFYATIELGTPPHPFDVIVDTGSTVTYVPCASCGENCGPNHKDAAFNPRASSSYQAIACSSPDCLCGHLQCSCDAQNQCIYQRVYEEASSSAGLIIKDNLQLPSGGVPIVFGCETRETGEIFRQQADGLMGLGNSDISIVNQLVKAGEIDDVFSLCFGGMDGDGALLLGNVSVPPYTNSLQYTPLLTSAYNKVFFTVTLEQMDVNGSALPVAREEWNRGYGAVLDSGTTFGYLPTHAFQAFRDTVSAYALSKGLQYVEKPDPEYNDVCFGHVPYPNALSQYFPSSALHFAGGVQLPLQPVHYLYQHPRERNAYCLAISDNGLSGSLLGGILFRDYLIQYDKKNSRVGFAAAPCRAIGLGTGMCTDSNGTAIPCQEPVTPSRIEREGDSHYVQEWASWASDHSVGPIIVGTLIIALLVVITFGIIYGVRKHRQLAPESTWFGMRPASGRPHDPPRNDYEMSHRQFEGLSEHEGSESPVARLLDDGGGVWRGTQGGRPGMADSDGADGYTAQQLMPAQEDNAWMEGDRHVDVGGASGFSLVHGDHARSVRHHDAPLTPPEVVLQDLPSLEGNQAESDGVHLKGRTAG
ncbi:hypothetical protein WJX73_003557 [Symbiochloris irregularis]|uniref:Peptidase A1 domain-containing protein n=1 Tax=Symbiochloris irregularis TaxID=706552 RepID=A0AAW1NQ91_9CHLO